MARLSPSSRQPGSPFVFSLKTDRNTKAISPYYFSFLLFTLYHVFCLSFLFFLSSSVNCFFRSFASDSLEKALAYLFTLIAYNSVEFSGLNCYMLALKSRPQKSKPEERRKREWELTNKSLRFNVTQFFGDNAFKNAIIREDTRVINFFIGPCSGEYVTTNNMTDITKPLASEKISKEFIKALIGMRIKRSISFDVI